MNNETSYFLFQIISNVQKVFLCFLIFTVFVEASLVVEAPGNCPVCSPLNPALARSAHTPLTCSMCPAASGLICRTAVFHFPSISLKLGG